VHVCRVGVLHDASCTGDVSQVRLALQAGEEVDVEDHECRTALMCASMYGHVSTIRALLKARAAVDLKSSDDGVTALMLASTCWRVEALQVLLEAGAAVDLKDDTGSSALLGAIHIGHPGVARLLLEAGAAPPPVEVPILGPHAVQIVQLLALHHEVWAAEARRVNPGMAAAEAAAETALANGWQESRQATARQKKQRQKTKRAEAMPGPAQAGGARSGPDPSSADPPSQCSGSPADDAAAGEEQRTAAEEGQNRDEGGASAGAGRRHVHASTGADERGGAEEEERAVAVAASLDPPPVVSLPAEEVLRALEAAGSDGEVGEGGFGKVFAAELPSLAARWGRAAVKSASVPHATDILQEVAMLRLCSHRNLLLLLGYCDDARAPCMVTPLMCGGSLDDRLLLLDSVFERLRRLGFEGDACLDWQLRLSALCDAARGLAHLHGERILHRDVKTANILLEGALRPLPMAHGPPLLVHRAVLSDVGLAKVREPRLGGATTHATTRNSAVSVGFVDPTLIDSNQHSEKTDAYDIGICVLMSLVSEPATGLMKDHEDDVSEAMEDGTGPLFGTAHAAAGWPSDATRTPAAVVRGLSIASHRKRQPLAEALAQMEALLGLATTDTAAAASGPQIQSPGQGAKEGPFSLPRPLRSRVGPMPAMAEGGPPAPISEPAAMAAAAMETTKKTSKRAAAAKAVGAAVGAGADTAAWRAAARAAAGTETGTVGVASLEAAAISTPSWPGGELTRMVRQIELGDADAPLARMRERVTKAYDSMMVRLERAYAGQGHAPLLTDEQELRKIDLLAPRHLGRLNGLAHTLRMWWNAAKHQRDQWAQPPSDKEVHWPVRDMIAVFDGLGW